MEYVIEDLTKEDAEYIGGKINEIVPRETDAGDWNVGFFKKNGYLLRGELKDVPKGHSCYELYKMI